METQVSTDVKKEDASDLSMLAIISSAASNPDVDVEKMQALLSMQMQIEERDAKRAFEQAFIRMQSELPEIDKNGSITGKNGRIQSKYARWEDIDRVIRPILQSHGFALRFDQQDDNNMTQVCAILSHVGGHVERSGYMKLPADRSGSKNDVQGAGSTLSYGKRYTAVAMLNIVTSEDTDGLGIGTPQEKPPLPEQLRKDCQTAADAGGYEGFYKSLEPAIRDLIYSHHFEDHTKWKTKSAANATPSEPPAGDIKQPGDDGYVEPNFDNL